MGQLLQDSRASAASIARAAGLPTSTAHRVVRRVLDEGWVKPRLETVSEWLGFQTRSSSGCGSHRARPPK